MKIKIKILRLMKKRENERRSIFSKPSLDFFGLVLLIYVIIKFSTGFSIQGMVGMGYLFLGLLWYFVQNKKDSKKKNPHTRNKKGEWWVAIWIFVVVTMFILNLIFSERFCYPEEEIEKWFTAICVIYLYGKSNL